MWFCFWFAPSGAIFCYSNWTWVCAAHRATSPRNKHDAVLWYISSAFTRLWCGRFCGRAPIGIIIFVRRQHAFLFSYLFPVICFSSNFSNCLLTCFNEVSTQWGQNYSSSSKYASGGSCGWRRGGNYTFGWDVREERVVNDTLVVWEIPSVWTVAAWRRNAQNLWTFGASKRGSWMDTIRVFTITSALRVTQISVVGIIGDRRYAYGVLAMFILDELWKCSYCVMKRYRIMFVVILR